MRYTTVISVAGVLMAVAAPLGTLAQGVSLQDKELLGQLIFHDKQLSINNNQSCADCHAPRVGWTGPEPLVNLHGAVYEGSIKSRFGNRKPPSAAYATPSPILTLVDPETGTFVGGNFWDGRATGEKLGNPAADQAQGPFLNPLEQAVPDSACVVYQACTSARYGALFRQVWGAEVCAIAWPSKREMKSLCASENASVVLSETDRARADAAYDDIALSIAAYEASPAVNQFSSKYDAYLAGQATLTPEENRGLALFQGKAKCAACHTAESGPDGEGPLFTDYGYDNLGVPKNPENPFYAELDFNPLGEHWVDLGLGGFLASRTDFAPYAAASYGKQKVPTLRNVDLRPGQGVAKAFTHNGWFKSLRSIVHFFNTRDVKPRCPERPQASPPSSYTEAEALTLDCWPEPEVAVNLSTDALGNLGLTAAEEDAIVAFLRTLSDGYLP